MGRSLEVADDRPIASLAVYEMKLLIYDAIAKHTDEGRDHINSRRLWDERNMVRGILSLLTLGDLIAAFYVAVHH